MTYQPVGMAYNLNAGNMANASFDSIDADVQRILNGAPEPDVDTSCPYSTMILHETPEYAEEYQALLDYHARNFGHSRSWDVDEYGFSHWHSRHWLMDNITMTCEQYHWHHMKQHVEKIEREIKIRELESGVKYSNEDRIALVRERAKQLRDEEVDWHRPRWQAALTAAQLRPRREFLEDRMAALQPKQNNCCGNVVDTAVDFQQRHPFLAGLIGADLYHRIKDAFSK